MDDHSSAGMMFILRQRDSRKLGGAGRSLWLGRQSFLSQFLEPIVHGMMAHLTGPAERLDAKAAFLLLL